MLSIFSQLLFESIRLCQLRVANSGNCFPFFRRKFLRRFDRASCGLEPGGKAVHFSQKILAVIRFSRFWGKNRGNAVKMFPSSFFEVIGLYRFGFRHRGKCYFLSGNYESLQLHEVSV